MNSDIDNAIETAASRTREAQERLIGNEGETPSIAPGARVVERRAEDLHDLASTAVHQEALTDEGGKDT